LLRSYRVAFGVLCSLFLSSCSVHEQTKFHDPKLQMKKEDYDKKLLAPEPLKPKKPLKKTTKASDIIPKEFYKPVSLSLSDSVPLKDIFLRLAQSSGVNIIVSPDIQGGAVLHASQRPLIELVEEICLSHGLRYQINNRMLKVMVDKPYMQSYNLEFLILSRQNNNRFSVATDVFTAPEGYQGDEDNGSNTQLTAETKTDFWQELSDNLNIILEDAPGDTPSRYTIHKQAGIISVFAPQSQQKIINDYLDQLRESVQRQVLIEAKIVEVNLKDEFKSGINWNALKGDFVLQAPLGSIATVGKHNPNSAPARNVFTLGGSGKEVTGLISLLDNFGTVRTLSNPRLTVINNQPAVLKVATNKVYFKLNYTRDYNYFDKREQVYVSSDAKTVPIGLVMVVLPSIRKEDGKIVMTMRPTISRIIQEVADPAVGIASDQKQTSFVPEVQVRELDSVLSMTSGETVVVGGLMEERSNNETQKVPDVADIPILGALFQGKANERHVTELVIFITATILDNDDYEPEGQTTTISTADQRVYQTFTHDPRPM